MREINRMLARVPFAPVVAAMFAIVAVVLVVATPQWLFERWVVLSGVANVIAAAAPPLGETARILAAIVAGSATAGLVWFGLTLMTKLRREAEFDDREIAPSRERSVRRPLSAGNELGAPLMSDEAMAQAREELVLDVPLFEAGLEGLQAAPAVDDAVQAPMPPLVEPREEPVDRAPPSALRARRIDGQSIKALLDRLETAIARKPKTYKPDRGDIARLRQALGQ